MGRTVKYSGVKVAKFGEFTHGGNENKYIYQ